MRWKSRTCERVKRLSQWHRWFALWPVHVGEGEFVWLQWIERRIEYLSGYDGTYAFPEYRSLPQPSNG